MPIRHHFLGCKAPLARASHVKWRYTKYLALTFMSPWDEQRDFIWTSRSCRLLTVWSHPYDSWWHPDGIWRLLTAFSMTNSRPPYDYIANQNLILNWRLFITSWLRSLVRKIWKSPQLSDSDQKNRVARHPIFAGTSHFLACLSRFPVKHYPDAIYPVFRWQATVCMK